jgi:hypothetical protein
MAPPPAAPEPKPPDVRSVLSRLVDVAEKFISWRDYAIDRGEMDWLRANVEAAIAADETRELRALAAMTDDGQPAPPRFIGDVERLLMQVLTAIELRYPRSRDPDTRRLLLGLVGLLLQKVRANWQRALEARGDSP